MPSCDLCGKSSPLFIVVIEGSQLSVCEKCSALGKVIKRIAAPIPKEKPKHSMQTKPMQTGLIIVGDYAKRIRQARESRGLSQKEFAMKLNERESLVQHLENSKLKPSVNLARKLERMLSIKLIEEVEEEQEEEGPSADSDSVLTLGDVIKIRKR